VWAWGLGAGGRGPPPQSPIPNPQYYQIYFNIKFISNSNILLINLNNFHILIDK